jgi:hypothetical protein
MANTVTLTLTAAEASQLAGALVDSATRWHQLWQDAIEGRRPDLTPEGCSALRRAAWAQYDKLRELVDAN